MKNSDMPAYPHTITRCEEAVAQAKGVGIHISPTVDFSGMTKREAFAMAAMQGILSGINANVYNGEWHGWSEIDFAEHAVKNADALLAELEK